MSGPFGAGALQYFSGAKKFYPFVIDQSLRFNDDDSASLSRTPSSAGNMDVWTWSCWVKLSSLNNQYLLSSYAASNDAGFFGITFRDTGSIRIQGWNTVYRETNALFKDFSSWYHIVVAVDTTDGTADNRIKLYVNGSQITSFATNNTYTQNADTRINNTSLHYIGRFVSGEYLDGYMAEANFIDGSQLSPTSFGETKENIWIPKDTSGLTFGTNGFRLKFQDSSALGDDTSGNGNDFTANNLASTDQMPDSPTNNRATFNGLLKDVRHTTTLSDGNKTISFTSGSEGFSGVPLTIFRDSGQAYCEVNLDRTYSGNSTDSQCVFVISPEQDISAVGSGSLNNKLVGSYCGGGSSSAPAEISSNGVDQGGSPSKYRSTNDRVGVYIDFDAGKGFFALNGTVQTVNGTPDIANGTNPHFTFTANSRLTVGVGGVHALTPAILTLKDHPNDWGTTPPDGYTAFATVDLPDPGIDPNKNENPTDYFNTVLYSGNGTARSITGVGFEPAWVWFKNRSRTNNHLLYDSVRGATKTLRTDKTDAESTNTGKLTSFDSDGFSLGTDNNPNRSGDTFVAWNWKAGGSASSNTDGSITSSVSASPESGFSVFTYTGTGSADSVGHGLGITPKLVIFKNRDSTSGWLTLTTAIDGTTDYLTLSATAAKTDLDTYSMTSSVVNFGGASSAVNNSSDGHVAYAVAEIEGYSRAGKYVGTGSTQFVYTGFRPAWVLIKSSNQTRNWILFDNKRTPTNEMDGHLHPSANVNEQTGTDEIDFLSNGFNFRSGDADTNTDAFEYIFLAFADQPFKYANAK